MKLQTLKCSCRGFNWQPQQVTITGVQESGPIISSALCIAAASAAAAAAALICPRILDVTTIPWPCSRRSSLHTARPLRLLLCVLLVGPAADLGCLLRNKPPVALVTHTGCAAHQHVPQLCERQAVLHQE